MDKAAINQASVEKFQTSVAELESSNAGNVAPTQFAYLQSLSKRLSEPRHAENTILIEKAEASLDEYQSNLYSRSNEMQLRVKQFSAQFPEQSETIDELFKRYEFNKLDHLFTRLTDSLASAEPLQSLSQLVDEISQPTGVASSESEALSFDEQLYQQEQDALVAAGHVMPSKLDGEGEQLELQSMKFFRESMKYVDIDKIIAQAIDDCPENPGPHNPQMLAVRSLTIMRDLSPQYLRRFAGHIETMLWLERSATKLNAKK